MVKHRIFLTACGLLMAAPALAQPAVVPDIVWPTYTVAARPGDETLSCTQLRGALDHVGADINMLSKAQYRAEDALRATFDTTSSEGRSTSPDQNGPMLNTKSSKWGFVYEAAREQIIASKKVAMERQEYLQTLQPGCKEPPSGP